MRHAVLGVGAVGGLVAGALARAGDDVVLLIREGGLTSYPKRLAVSSTVLGSFEVPAHAVSTLDSPVDVLWVATKAMHLAQAVKLAPAAIVAEATVIPLLNGVDHVAALRARYRRVLPAAIRVEAEKAAPATIVHRSPFVRIDLVEGDRADAIAEHVRAAGIECNLRADEAVVLWEKLAFLAPLALTTTALNAPVGDVRADPIWRRRLEQVQREVVAAACAAGASLDEPALESAQAGLPDAMRSSMQKDLAAGRPLELEAIAGPIIRAAGRHGLEVPITRELVQVIARLRDLNEHWPSSVV